MELACVVALGHVIRMDLPFVFVFSKLEILNISIFFKFHRDFADFHEISSDFLEKRCKYSKFLDFNLTLA